VELLVVISIIGLLATLAIVALKNTREKANIAKTKGDLKQIQTAIEVARDRENKVLGRDYRDGNGVTGSGCSDCSCRPPSYTLDSPQCITSMTNAFNKLGFAGLLRDPWESPYLIDENEYEFSGDPCRRDTVRSAGPNRMIGGGDDLSIYIPFYLCD
ncbi:type II secretion system GspH family protein, partial [Patescibacteria group bacterium]|nr:type II secretion system GspH family protein [Patescibacteria group bacterium]